MRKTIITLVVASASLVPVATIADGDGMPPSKDQPGAASERAAAGKTRITQADLAEDAPGEYTVVKGDTLWGISGRFLKDPWKWPLIWEMNQDQIKNPHLIYPGDVIKLDRERLRLTLASGGTGGAGGGSGGTEAQAQANVVKLDPRIRVEPIQSAIPTIPASVIGPFLSQPLIVEAGALDNAPAILATEESRVIVGSGDVAYADRIGSNDGVNWQVYRPGSPLRDPETNEILGYEAKYVGDARVRRYGNPTTLELTKTRQEVNRGDRLQPARESVFPSYVPRSPDKPIKGAIMSVEGGVSEFGQYQIITINRGARDGIEVGHVLASYRRGEVVNASGRTVDFFSSGRVFGGMDVRPVPVVPDPPSAAPPPPAEPGKVTGVAQRGAIKLPDERNGLIFVFRVFEKLSYALVVRSTRPIYIGDVVMTP